MQVNSAPDPREKDQDADPTICIGYAGGHMTIRLSAYPPITLEMMVTDWAGELVKDTSRTVRKFDNLLDAWIAAGREIGWVQG